MISLHEIIDGWSMTIWRASWQGGLLAVAVWMLCRLLPSMPARIQSWLWRLVVAKFVVALFVPALELPLLPVNEEITASVASGVSLPQSAADVPPGPWLHSPSSYVFLAWAIGVCGQIVRLNWQHRRACRIRREGRAIVNRSLHDQVAQLCSSIGLRTQPEILETTGGGSPMLAGILSPTILFPALTLSRLDDSERSIVIAHELAHIQRGDLFWSLLSSFVRAVFFFHPLAWMTDRRLKLVQEIATDELAIRLNGNSPADYGHLLLSVIAKFGSERLLSVTSAGASGPQESLKERLIAMRHVQKSSLKAMASFVVLLGVVTVIGVMPWHLVAREPDEKDLQQAKYEASIRISEELDGKEKTVLHVPTIRFAPGQKTEADIGEGANRVRMTVETNPKRSPAEHTLQVKFTEAGENPATVSAPRLTVADGATAKVKIMSTSGEQDVEATIRKAPESKPGQ